MGEKILFRFHSRICHKAGTRFIAKIVLLISDCCFNEILINYLLSLMSHSF